MKKTISNRLNLYLDKDLMQAITNKANERYLPKAVFVKQLLFMILMTNENNTSMNLNENGK